LCEITDEDFNTMAEKRLRLPGAAHEYTRTVAALKQMVDDPGSYIPRRSCDEIGHKAPWLRQNMFSSS
jgi:hypothetical protein